LSENKKYIQLLDNTSEGKDAALTLYLHTNIVRYVQRIVGRSSTVCFVAWSRYWRRESSDMWSYDVGKTVTGVSESSTGSCFRVKHPN